MLITFALPAGLGHASSHREAPLTAADPDIDNTDTYAFTSPDMPESVTLITNVKPFQLPAGGPIFDPFPNGSQVRYNINVDTNGDANPDLTFRFTFSGGYRDKSTFLYNTGVVNNLSDPTLNFLQHYKLELLRPSGTTTLVADGLVPPNNVGKASMPNYAALRQQALATGIANDGIRSFAGSADDPFFIDIRVFDLLYGGNLSETGNPSLSGLNVSTLAVQVPKSFLRASSGADKSGIIGVYATTERRSIKITARGTREGVGNWVQVSRLGNPLVNEVISSTAIKDAFNNLKPHKDIEFRPLLERIYNPEVPRLVEKIYGIPAPPTPRNDLFAVFMTGVKGLNMPPMVRPSEMLRLNMDTALAGTPNRLGVLAGDNAGFPNGRRLTDDVVDIELQALEGALQPDGSVKLVEALAAGDRVNMNDVPLEPHFPYVAEPHAGSNPGTGGTASTDNNFPPSAGSGATTPMSGGSSNNGTPVGALGSNTAPATGAALLAVGLVIAAGLTQRRQAAAIA